MGKVVRRDKELVKMIYTHVLFEPSPHTPPCDYPGERK
jgi:hypothetical protein